MMAEQGLVALANDINTEHGLCVAAMAAGLNHAIRAGDLLAQAKAACQHGTWVQWIADNCEFTPRQAQRYMLVAERKDELLSKTTRVSHLSFRGALALLSEPQATPAPPDGDAVAMLEEKARQVHKCLAAVEQMTRRFIDANGTAALNLVKASHPLFMAAAAASKEALAEFKRLLDSPDLSLTDCVRVERIALSLYQRHAAGYIRWQWQTGVWMAEVAAVDAGEGRKLRASLEGVDLKQCRCLAQMDTAEVDDRINEIVDAGDELTTAAVLRYSFGWRRGMRAMAEGAHA